MTKGGLTYLALAFTGLLVGVGVLGFVIGFVSGVIIDAYERRVIRVS